MRIPKISTPFFIRTAREQIHRAFEPVHQLVAKEDKIPDFVMDALERGVRLLDDAVSLDDVRDVVTALDGIAGFAKRHAPNPTARAALRTLDGVLDELHKRLGEAKS